MLCARARFGGRSDRAAVRVRVRLRQGHLSVAAGVRVAEQAGGEVVREEASGDLFRLLRFLVRGGRGDEHQPARTGLAGALHVEGGHLANAFHPGDRAGLTRIEEADAHVHRRVLQMRAQLAERQPRVAEPQVAVLRVSREVEEEQRFFAPLAGGGCSILESAQRGPHVVGVDGREKPRIVLANPTEPHEDAVDAARVALRVPERPRSRPTLRVAYHQSEPMHVRMRRSRGDEERERQGAIHGARSSSTCTTSAPRGAALTPFLRIASASTGRSANTAINSARRAVPVHSKAVGSCGRAGPL